MTRRTEKARTINAYITGEGVIEAGLAPHVPALNSSDADEYALRSAFLDQQGYYAGKKTPGEVIGVIVGSAAKATLFDNGTAIVYFWRTKKNLSAKWTRA